MSLTITHAASATGTDRASRSRLRSLLARLVAALMQEIRIRRDMRLLSGLDEAALHDMGLTRGGVEDAVRHGRTEMPGLNLIELAPAEPLARASRPSAQTPWR